MTPRVLLLLLLCGLAASPQEKKPSAKETELKRAIVAGWIDLAAWACPKGLEAECKPMLEEIRSLDPANPKLKTIGEKSGGAAPSEAIRKEFDRKREGCARRASALYVLLAKEPHAAADQAPYDGYVIRAFGHDPAGAASSLEGIWRDAVARKDWERARRILTAAEAVKSDPVRVKVLKEIELKGAESTPILRQAAGHDMKYYLVLPKDWTPAKKWPVVVGVEGAGCDWKNMIGSLLGARGDRPYLLVTPVTFSNTNALEAAKYPYPPELLESANRSRLTFDEEGLLAVLAELRKDFGAEEKIRITGFSGGGNLCWRMTFGHPQLLAASAPACPNFGGTGTVSDAPEREQLPVHVFQGDKDEYWEGMLSRQWDFARELLERSGFKNVKHTMLPGVGHANCAQQVMDFFASVKPAK